jgi:hypothetical protein
VRIFGADEKAGKGGQSTADDPLGAHLQIRNPQSAIRNPWRLFSVDSLVPRKNRNEVFRSVT